MFLAGVSLSRGPFPKPGSPTKGLGKTAAAHVIAGLLALLPATSRAQNVCFFPDPPTGSPQVYSTTPCATEIDWPTSWTAVGQQSEAEEAAYTALAYNAVGSASYPGMYVTKRYVAAQNADYLFFRVRVAYAGTVNASSGEPFAPGAGTISWLLTTTDPTSSAKPEFSIAWDLKQPNWQQHGLEMTYQAGTFGTPPRWSEVWFDDVDGTQASKCEADIDGYGTGGSCAFLNRHEGYVRTVDSVTYGAGTSTFVEMAVSCAYFKRVAGTAHIGTFNPCDETFWSSGATGSNVNDAVAWKNNGSVIDIYGIGVWNNETDISSAAWGSSYDPTPVVIAEISAHPRGEGLEVRWQTASEVGTVGFNLHRVDPLSGARTQLNRTLVPAAYGSPNGGRYAVMDRAGARAGETLYVVEEIEAGGRRRAYGPFLVRPTPAGTDSLTIGPDGWARGERVDAPGMERRRAALRGARDTRGPGRSSRATGGSFGRVVVSQPGLQVVTSADVALALGMNEPEARVLIRQRKLRLAGPLGDAACEPDDAGTRLYFHARPLNSTWSDTAVFRLARGSCAPFRRVHGSPPRSEPPPPATFVDRAHLEEDLLPAPVTTSDPDGDFWLWAYVVGGSASAGSVTVDLPTPDATARTGEVTLSLQGASATVENDHHVRVSLNGASLGDVRWGGATPASATFTVPADTLKPAGSNALRLEALLDAGVPYSVEALGGIDVAWERKAIAHGDRLEVPAGVAGDFLVAGFRAGDAWVLDLSRPEQPARVPTASGCRDDSCFARFLADPGAGPYLVVRPAAAHAPRVEPMAGAEPLAKLARRGADYLVITSPALEQAAGALASLREAGGLRTVVVTTDRIYDTYGGGNLDPKAIRAFLLDVHGTWRRKPQFVVLAGSGTYDGRDVLGVGDEHVPPMLVGTPFGLVASDVALADVEGDDGVPEFAIGRIPASTVEEFLAYVGKLRAREAAPGTWSGRALFLADTGDAGGDFAADSATSAGILGGGFASLQVQAAGDVAGARVRTLQALATGAGVFHFFGHAGSDRLASGGLLTSADVVSLRNGGNTPFAMFMTCAAGAFGYPGFDSLAAKLVLQPDGGSIATWASSSWEMHADSRILSQQALTRIAAAPGAAVGTIVREAFAASREADIPTWTRLAYNLFGDPAVGVAP